MSSTSLLGSKILNWAASKAEESYGARRPPSAVEAAGRAGARTAALAARVRVAKGGSRPKPRNATSLCHQGGTHVL